MDIPGIDIPSPGDIIGGIGGFFDAYLNSLLMLGPEHAIAYITTIGVPA